MKILSRFVLWTEQWARLPLRESEAQRIRRRQALNSTIMALAGYQAPYLIAVAALLLGFQPYGVAPFVYLYLYTLMTNVFVYVLILRTRQLDDQFLYWQTILQLLFWLFMFACYAFLMAELRSVALMFALMVFFFVALIGSLKEACVLGAGIVASYLAGLQLGERLFSQPYSSVSEILYLGSFLLVSLFLTIVGHSMRISRDKSRYMRLHLQQTQSELSRAMSQLERKARTDDLTGLDNRRWARELLESKMQQARPGENVATLMLLDIDRFKSINDTFGHDAGDEVLKQIATRLTSLKRDGDLLARWGGEEFLMVWPSKTLSAAIPIAERLRQAVETLSIKSGSHQIQVTFSAGLAELRGGNDLDQIIKVADLRLYEAKEKGRNQISHLTEVPH